MAHLIVHGTCRKNQNFLAQSPVYDGCLEYMNHKESESLRCEACGCHRNFHERVNLTEDERSHRKNLAIIIRNEEELNLKSDKNEKCNTKSNCIQAKTTGNVMNIAEEPDSWERQKKSLSNLIGETKAEEPDSLDLKKRPSNKVLMEANMVERKKQKSSVIKVEEPDLDDKEDKQIPSYRKGNAVQNEGIDVSDMKEYKWLVKLRTALNTLQKLHPDSPLELQYIDNGWRVYCVACKENLEPDHQGTTFPNMKRHLSTPKHKNNISIMKKEEEEERPEQCLIIRED